MRTIWLFIALVLVTGCSGTATNPVATTPSVLSSDQALQSWVDSDPFGRFSASELAERLRSGEAGVPGFPPELLQAVVLAESDVQFLNLALQAYLWGYAPMTVYRLDRAKTNSQAPLNHFFHATHLPDWQLPSPVSAPDVDVLYSSAFLDLSRGPLILHIPAIESYYVVQIDDLYGNSQASLGTRTRPGTAEADFLLVGPDDPGYTDASAHLADGFDAEHVVPIDTPHAWVIVRVPVDAYSVPGSPGSLQASDSYAANSQFTLAPLQGVLRPDPMFPELATLFESPPENALIFFRWLGEAVAENPIPTRAAFQNSALPPYLMSPSASVGQSDLFATFAPLGLDESGFHPTRLTARQLILLQAAFLLGNRLLQAGQSFILTGPASQNHWHVTGTSAIGKYPNTWSGWFVRSVAAFEGGIASLAPDGTYPLSGYDSNGNPLAGGQSYRLRFPAGQLPPINSAGFWSVTVYTNDSASGSQANLPGLAAAAAENTAYSQVCDRPLRVIDTSHFQGAYEENDTLYFQTAVAGLEAETPYYVFNLANGSFQLSRTWNVDSSQMTAVTVDPSLVGRQLLSGEVIPVYSLGSQQLPGNQSLRGASLSFNQDGSLDLYLQPDSPAGRGNWLPIPAQGTFQVMMRLYDPAPATPQSGGLSILSTTTIPLTTSDPALASQYPQEPVTSANRYGTYVVPAITPLP